MADKIETTGNNYKVQLERTMDMLQQEVQSRHASEKVPRPSLRT
jgi:hypothetical protein